MQIADIIRRSRQFAFEKFYSSMTSAGVRRTLDKDRFSLEDLAALLSDEAQGHLEPMANRAAMLTRQHFGNVIFIFTPLYISNFCDNRCAYCSFAAQHEIGRKQLSFDEIRAETQRIAETGIRHILVLTGEARVSTSFEYVRESIAIIAERFSSIGIEMYPMSRAQYASLVDSGVDSLTLYQEVYDEDAYRAVHAGGPKQDYGFRLEAPDRACSGGVRAVTVGALLGLGDMRREMYSLAHHVRYLQDTYPDVEVSVSVPRIRPLVRDFAVPYPVSERQLVQIVAAFRLVFPHVGITLSTRESKKIRDGMLPLGITKMSAGVSTAVGGHSKNPSTTQFEIADTRSVDEMRADLLANGFQAVMHDWHRRLVGVKETL